MYKVIVAFSGNKKEDGFDGVFEVNKPYPHSSTPDFKPTKARITYLMNEAKQKNNLGMALLQDVGGKQVVVEPEPEPIPEPTPDIEQGSGEAPPPSASESDDGEPTQEEPRPYRRRRER